MNKNPLPEKPNLGLYSKAGSGGGRNRMIDYKLMSVDTHMSGQPAPYKRVKTAYDARALRGVENPEGTGTGLYFIMNCVEPMHID
jgi:hypothetical protein